MLFVAIHRTGSAGGGTSPAGARTLVLGDTSLEVIVDGPAGLCVDGPESVVIAETMTPATQHDLERMSQRLRGGEQPQDLLNADMLVGVAFDTRSGSITVANSIAGWMSVYWVSHPGEFIVSTSVRVLQEAGVPVAWDDDCLPEYLSYRVVAAPGSHVRGIRKVIGGQTLVVGLDDGRTRSDRRWGFPRRAGGNDGGVEAVGEALSDQVRRTVQGFPSPGVLLSGGLDSSLLAALAADVRRDIPTFSGSFSFANAADQEAEYARSMARALGVPHTVLVGSEERYLAGWVAAIRAAGQPLHHLQSVILFLLLTDLAAAGQTALLSGEGADGLFGNDSHFALRAHRKAVSILRSFHVGTLLAPSFRALGVSGRRRTLLTLDYGSDIASPRHFVWTVSRYNDPALTRRILDLAAADTAAAPIGQRVDMFMPYRTESLLDQVTMAALLGDVQSTTSIWGSLGEAVGIRLQFAFPTPAVIEAVTAVPWELKLKEPKHLVRAGLRHAGVPESLISRPKLSFGLPATYWALPRTLFQPVVDLAKTSWPAGTLESLQNTEGAMMLWCLLNRFLWQELFERRRDHDDLAGEIVDRLRYARSS